MKNEYISLEKVSEAIDKIEQECGLFFENDFDENIEDFLNKPEGEKRNR